MGKLSHDLHFQHFSHPHLLELTNSQTLNITTPCSACKLQSSGWMYTCKPCNFTLHTSCSQLPQLITHPAHAHPLTLLPTPVYPVGFFSCDACGQQGHGFSYHCYQCDFDIHSVCASKPLSILHQSHPCQLQLFFYPPYQTKGFSCDVCCQIGSNHWLYRCSICSFDVHLSCASTAAAYTNTTRQTNIQFQRPNTYQGPNNVQYRNAPVQMNNQCNYMQPQSQNNNGAAMSGNALMDAAVQGFVEGAAQQIGQNFVQGLMGDDPNNGSNGDSGNNNSSSSIFDIGSSLCDGILGNS